MRRSAWFRVMAVLLAGGLIAAACGDDDGDDESAAPDPPTAAEAGCEETVPGSRIDYGVFAPAVQLDPPMVSGGLVGGTELASVYDVLFTYDYEADAYKPKLAESLEPNDDFTRWTLKLREGITYSDGTPLDAQLVSDNMDRFSAPGARNNAAGYLQLISDKRVVDERTLEFTLERSWVEFPFTFAHVVGSVANLNAIGDDPEAFGAQPPDEAGLGPYVVERNVPGEELVLRARSDYWDGPVCVETLRFVFVPGAQATYDAFRSGELDVAFLREPAVIEAARDAGEDGFFIQQDAGAQLLLNHADGRPGADPRVREAMLFALDENVINERAYEGALSVSKTLIQPGSRFYSDDVEAFPTDADRARQLLEEARADGFDGRVEVLCSNAPPAPETALASEGLLEAVGFDVEVRTLPTTDQIGQVLQGQFDAACWGLNAAASTAHVNFWVNLHSESSTNRIGYRSPEMDAALVEMMAAEPDDLQAVFAEINRIFNDDAVAFNYGAPEEGVIWKDGIKGVVPGGAATVFLFDKAYIEE